MIIKYGNQVEKLREVDNRLKVMEKEKCKACKVMIRNKRCKCNLDGVEFPRVKIDLGKWVFVETSIVNVFISLLRW